MGKDIFNALLDHLKDSQPDSFQDVTHIINPFQDEEMYNFFYSRVLITIEYLKEKGYMDVKLWYEGKEKDLYFGNKNEYSKGSIRPHKDSVKFLAAITNEGKIYWQEKSREIAQTEAITKTAKFQKIFGRWSIILTSLSVIFIGITVYQTYHDKTAQELQQIQEQLRQINTTLKQVAPSQRVVNPANVPDSVSRK